mmetsp:Transcript_646/g.2031  ORF Transcript_646/g.2031 Transcript_646/m.2031 type:complete len:316 (-) Transcript_646:14-961(-)
MGVLRGGPYCGLLDVEGLRDVVHRHGVDAQEHVRRAQESQNAVARPGPRAPGHRVDREAGGWAHGHPLRPLHSPRHQASQRSARREPEVLQDQRPRRQPRAALCEGVQRLRLRRLRRAVLHGVRQRGEHTQRLHRAAWDRGLHEPRGPGERQLRLRHRRVLPGNPGPGDPDAEAAKRGAAGQGAGFLGRQEPREDAPPQQRERQQRLGNQRDPGRACRHLHGDARAREGAAAGGRHRGEAGPATRHAGLGVSVQAAGRASQRSERLLQHVAHAEAVASSEAAALTGMRRRPAHLRVSARGASSFERRMRALVTHE